MSFVTTYFIEYNGEVDVEVTVEFNASPYIPARTSGPVENCCEAEGGEVEITGIYLDGEEISKELDTKVLMRITKHCESKADALIKEAIHQDELDAAEGHYDGY